MRRQTHSYNMHWFTFTRSARLSNFETFGTGA